MPESHVPLQQSVLPAHEPPSLTQQNAPTLEPLHWRPGQQGKAKAPGGLGDRYTQVPPSGAQHCPADPHTPSVHGKGPVQSLVMHVPPFGDGTNHACGSQHGKRVPTPRPEYPQHMHAVA